MGGVEVVAAAEDYPAHWEADVVLRDGTTAHLRPIAPQDADEVQRFHRRQSPESIYFRFFAPLPELSERADNPLKSDTATEDTEFTEKSQQGWQLAALILRVLRDLCG